MDSNLFLLSCLLSTLSVMARGDQGKSTQLNRYCTKARKGITAPISLEDLMEKEVQFFLQDGAIPELSVLTDPSNEDSNCIKQNIPILDHPEYLIKVLRARIAPHIGT